MNKKTFEKLLRNLKLFSLFSITTGILYQYVSIKGNMAFFSYSEVINDSIYLVPLIFMYVGSIYLSYLYIYNFKKINIFKIRKLFYDLLFLSINLGITYYMYYNVIHKIGGLTNNNILALLLMLIFITSLFNIFSHIYVYLFKKKHIKIMYIIFGGLIYFWSISNSNEVFYKDLCFTYEKDNIVHISYMNDKYIFLDNGNMITTNKVNEFYRLKDCKK